MGPNKQAHLQFVVVIDIRTIVADGNHLTISCGGELAPIPLALLIIAGYLDCIATTLLLTDSKD